MYHEVKACRICGNTDLVTVLDLGSQALTGIFPKTKERHVESMPLELVKCIDENHPHYCGLLQLKHTGDLSQFYGKDYGYRSGLNRSMVEHLHTKVKKISKQVSFKQNDLVIDIGSNDSTTLQAYPKEGLQLVGIDPTGAKFRSFYPNHIQLIPDFFTAEKAKSLFGEKKAKVITSISMFYDLERPMDFMKDVCEVLAEDGVWVFEQSYMPTMLEMNSYDTVCHEHLEYYGVKQIKWMTDRVGLKILDIEFNAVNGGSFSVMCAKKSSSYVANQKLVDSILTREHELGLHTLKPYEEFKLRVEKSRNEVREFLQRARREGKHVFGYGASTKGNVLLQYCGLTSEDIEYIAEVNEDKFGAFTPGTHIPIISEQEAKQRKPDYFFVLPWHFRDTILKREREAKGDRTFVFPLPHIDIVNSQLH